MNTMDNKDKLEQLRQDKITAGIEREEKLQKKREAFTKERRKDRLEAQVKKEASMENARVSVSQRV